MNFNETKNARYLHSKSPLSWADIDPNFTLSTISHSSELNAHHHNVFHFSDDQSIANIVLGQQRIW